MIPNQRKIIIATRRNSQPQRRQQQQPKTKEHQSNGEISQRTSNNPSTSTSQRKGKDVEKLMFSDEDALLRLKVGSNHVILKNIMAHLTVPSLKAARLVSKEWKKLANLELGRRKCCRLRLDEYWSEKRILGNSDDISWMEVDLKHLNVKKLISFATDYGHQVKILRLPGLESADDISPWRTIWNCLIAGKFPNLQILRFCKLRLIDRFSSSEQSPWPLECTSNPTTLPALKRIEEFNLSEVSRLPPNFLQYKGHLIKSANLDIVNCDRGIDPTTQITLLAQAKAKLERLVIGRGDLNPEFGKQINLILESSREALQTLEISLSSASPFYFQPQLSQSFIKLSTLHFGSYLTFFNLKTQLESLNQGCLPVLTSVEIEVNPWIKSDLPESPSLSSRKTASEGRGILTSVVSLEVKCKYQSGSTFDLLPSNWFSWLAACFPNVQNLTTENWRDTDEVLRHIFTLWPNLTSLSIHIYHGSTPDFKLDLDPVLTGLSLEKCQELRNHPEKMDMKMTKEILNGRTWPNLNSLKELKRLDFILPGSNTHPDWCPVSLISFLYAINLHFELKSRIRFFSAFHDYHKFLPLAQYAQLELFTQNGWTSTQFIGNRQC